MQRKFLAAPIFALFAFLFSISANAQSTSVVILPGGCGTANYQQNNPYLTVDSTGRECSNSIAAANGVSQGITAAGNAARVSQEPTQLFWDDFGTGTLDTTNKWSSPTTGGGGNATAASNAVGFTALGSGTTAGGWSLLSSQYSFPGKNPSWNFFQEQNNFEFPVLLNAVRFWGFATFPAAPTAAASYADAVGFELGTDGHLRAITSASAGSLAAGTKTVIADLSVACASTNPYGGPLGAGTTTSGCAPNLLNKINQPQDSNVHKYIIYFRGDNIYWAIDGIDNVVAFTITGAPGPNANTLNVAHAAIANTGTGPTSTALLTVNQTTVGDTGRNEIRVCDPVNPWRCSTVRPGSSAAASTDPSLVVQINPGSPGIVSLGQTTKSASVPVTIATDQYVDPCQSPNIAKSSVAINVTTATTTSLVATSGTTTIYVCGFSMTIAPSATTAATALFERGTGAACVTTQTALTGTFGNGEVPAANTTAPVPISYGGGATVFKSAGTDAICLLTAGTAVSVQGVMTYVQQ